MDIREQRKHRPYGEMGAHQPPYRIKGHVEMTISPFRQNIMKGFFTEFFQRVVKRAPYHVIPMIPTGLFLLGIKVYHDTVLEQKRKERYF